MRNNWATNFQMRRPGGVFRHFMRQDFIAGVGLLVFSTILVRALGMLFQVFLTWIFIPSDYGFVRYMLSISRLLGEVVIGGFPNALAQRIAAKRETTQRVRYVINTTFAIIGVLVVGVLPGTFLFDMSMELRIVAWVVIGGLVIDALFYSVLRGLARYKTMATYRILANALQMVVVLAVYGMGWLTPRIALLIYAYVYLLPIIGILVWTRSGRRLLSHIAVARIQLSRAALSDLLLISAPLMLSAVAYGIISGVDYVFIERSWGLHATGVYDASKTLTLVFTFVPFAVAAVLMPKVASATSVASIRQYTLWSLVACGGASMVLLGVVVCFGPAMLRLLYPAAYYDAGETLFVLSTGMVVFSVYTVLSQSWIGVGKPVPPTIALLSAALVNVLWNVAIVPVYGAIGAAWGFVLAYCTALLLLTVWTVRFVRHSPSSPNSAVATTSPTLKQPCSSDQRGGCTTRGCDC